MHCGLGTQLVSTDKFRDHLTGLEPNLKAILERWLRLSQVSMVGFKQFEVSWFFCASSSLPVTRRLLPEGRWVGTLICPQGWRWVWNSPLALYFHVQCTCMWSPWLEIKTDCSIYRIIPKLVIHVLQSIFGDFSLNTWHVVVKDFSEEHSQIAQHDLMHCSVSFFQTVVYTLRYWLKNQTQFVVNLTSFGVIFQIFSCFSF